VQGEGETEGTGMLQSQLVGEGASARVAGWGGGGAQMVYCKARYQTMQVVVCLLGNGWYAMFIGQG